MIKDRILVSDTNIFLDLMSVDLVAEFFSLPCEIYTTDLVMDEIVRPQERKELDTYVYTGRLKVSAFESEEFLNVYSLYVNTMNNTSLADCSVWYLAKKIGGVLLTGDAKLKKSAVGDSVKVSGILYVFDKLVEYDVIDHQTGAERLKRLLQINIRLPRSECVNRIEMWQNIKKTT